jgi:NitT/TauT family transport system permease protein
MIRLPQFSAWSVRRQRRGEGTTAPPSSAKTPAFERWRGLADAALLLGLFLLLYGTAKVGKGFFVAFNPPSIEPSVSLDPRNLPYYAARSTLRMFVALGLSILFTLTYGYAAAKNRYAERVLIPLLDILQSVPVLGFLSVTVTGFIALFPGSLFGLECASIFAIFTGQAWNMAFSFYNALITLPKELTEAATVFRFSNWRRFIAVEVPASMIGLVWNGMMSFGGGWFFVTVSEAISVLNRTYTLPGIGSYVAKAVEAKNVPALASAIVTMVLVIILVDQLFWKPLVAWSEKFRMDRSASGIAPQSWVLDLIRRAHLPGILGGFLHRLRDRAVALISPPTRVRPAPSPPPRRAPRLRVNGDVAFAIAATVVIAAALCFGARFVTSEVGPQEVMRAFGLGLLTLLRVALLLVLATVVWTPVGVAIGFSPRLARVMQPLVQVMASFPVNFVFPAATVVFLRTGFPISVGAILLMALGTQWYILFNVIAGAMAVPNDLREMARNMRLTGWPLWKKLILPAIFPALVTGMITASGGAWNASIVSEVVSWGDKTLKAQGLGAYIADATGKGDWPRIVLGVALMCLFVVVANRLVWRRLYRLAETRYRLG